MTLSRTTGVLIILAILVLGAAAYLLFGTKPQTPALTVTGASVSSAEVTFITLTAKIEPLSFDMAVLSDPRFQALIDLRTAVIPEPAGRTDPFAPLGR